ncbi:lipopolysaccharide heptosyltransferase I [Candidatus Paracaedibacter symbiosus]|uniref:lipopolysaccharide heptosyltransferase I n=1 Tax=Candidatus Paracaedibacter symbiosus TaxID=244582 RepID=UPI000A967293|nr:lipopolysaccharide heptosyltransferase I [Candidatus Paracaedibacter symbiosus]
MIKRILIVKVTSLGDVIEAQPVVSDLHRAFPGIKVDWAVDSAFADIVRWNTGVDRVLDAPLRRFKKTRNWSDFQKICGSVATLREEFYEVVIDIHGVYKSAIISFLPRSQRRFGYPPSHLGERGARFAYTHYFDKPCSSVNAWHGMRLSVAQALGYSVDYSPHYGLTIPGSVKCISLENSKPIAMLFHATSKDIKKWPSDRWITFGQKLTAQGFRVLLPWNSPQEYAEAVEIVAGVPGAEILPQLTLTECAQLIGVSALVVGMDTGLVHLAHALEKPTVMIFTVTSRPHFGIELPGRSISVGDEDVVPTVEEVWDATKNVLPQRNAITYESLEASGS